jgi:hypothetical protein
MVKHLKNLTEDLPRIHRGMFEFNFEAAFLKHACRIIPRLF